MSETERGIFKNARRSSRCDDGCTCRGDATRPVRGTWNDDPAHFRPPPRRREFLKVGVIGGIGLSLGDWFALTARAQEGGSAPATSPGVPPADSVIHIFLEGGVSHIDTFDPKPEAPIEVRGELGVVRTATGDYFGGLLQQTAGVADRICVIRSMGHTEAAHERGTHSMLTGYQPSPAIEYPSFGAVVSHELGGRQSLPPYVAVPTANQPAMGTGYLSSAYGPFSLGQDPAAGDFRVRDLALPPDVDDARFTSRRELLNAVNDHFRRMEKSEQLDAMDAFYGKAYELISSQAAREAFDIGAEDGRLRDAYGRHSIGQRLLIARRLVEAGVRFVTVTFGGFDFHDHIRDRMRGQFPQVDQAFAMLIRDLDSRGMLARTLVVLSTEFGRTPRLNKDAGRDHWPKVFSVALAGGGLAGGRVIGATDPTGAEPAGRGVSPADLAATIFTRIGVDPTKKLMSAGNRPIDIVRGGKVIAGLG
ncbi:MAG: DUF1501 domain-containing protein [Phycisphaerales bacterium]|nr:MAG: DUF1501 domain-containing protein [Phycisphaerales bacterium]